MLDEGVELVLGVLVFGSLALNANAELAGNVADTVNPDSAVETSVDLNFLGVHLLGSELLDVTNAAGCALLEGDVLEHLVDVERVVSAGGLEFLGHFKKSINNSFFYTIG